MIHETENVGLDERCDGLEASYEAGAVERFSVAGTGTSDLVGTGQSLAAKLRSGSYSAMFTLNQQIAIAAMRAVPEGVVVGTVDADPFVAKAVLDGDILFAIMTDAAFQVWSALDAAERIVQRYHRAQDVMMFDEALTFVSPGRTMIDPIVLSQENAVALLRFAQRLR